MRVQTLYLHNFRNYKQAEISFDPHVNCIVGPNAQGKSNLLEALYLLSTGRSFRTSKLTDLIRHGENHFYLEADIIKEESQSKITLSYSENQRLLKFNQTSYTNFTPLLGLLPTVLWAPCDHQLIAGAPQERRRFLDMQISQADSVYLHHLARYYRAMKQRNQLLKKQQLSTISSWEQIMALSASYLIRERRTLLNQLLPLAAQQLDHLLDYPFQLDLRYHSSFHCKTEDLYSEIINLLAAHRPREIELKSTLSGPHRDDFAILFNGQEARHFCSEGQKRILAVSLRLAEWKRLAEKHDEKPLFSIDDFSLHLDSKRQHELENQLSQLGQVFLTSPHPLLSNYNQLNIEQGSFVNC